MCYSVICDIRGIPVRSHSPPRIFITPMVCNISRTTTKRIQPQVMHLYVYGCVRDPSAAECIQGYIITRKRPPNVKFQNVAPPPNMHAIYLPERVEKPAFINPTSKSLHGFSMVPRCLANPFDLPSSQQPQQPPGPVFRLRFSDHVSPLALSNLMLWTVR
jgi:hypothetical protein